MSNKELSEILLLLSDDDEIDIEEKKEEEEEEFNPNHPYDEDWEGGLIKRGEYNDEDELSYKDDDDDEVNKEGPRTASCNLEKNNICGVNYSRIDYGYDDDKYSNRVANSIAKMMGGDKLVVKRKRNDNVYKKKKVSKKHEVVTMFDLGL